jgi:hypothetical protein
MTYWEKIILGVILLLLLYIALNSCAPAYSVYMTDSYSDGVSEVKRLGGRVIKVESVNGGYDVFYRFLWVDSLAKK